MRGSLAIVVVLCLASSAVAGGVWGEQTRLTNSDFDLRTGGTTSDSRMIGKLITADASGDVVATYFNGEIHDQDGTVQRPYKMAIYDSNFAFLDSSITYLSNKGGNVSSRWYGCEGFQNPPSFVSGDRFWVFVWCDTTNPGAADQLHVSGDITTSTDSVAFYNYSYASNSGVWPASITPTSTAQWNCDIFVSYRSSGTVIVYGTEGLAGDAEMLSTTTGVNRGGFEQLNFGKDAFGFSDYVSAWEAPDLTYVIPSGATCDSAHLTLNFTGVGGSAATIEVFQCWKPPVEAFGTGAATDTNGMSWTDWDLTALEWGTAAAGSTNDAGSENTTDGGGDDRKATAESSRSVSATGDVTWTISGSLVNGWFAGTYNYQWLIIDETNGGNNRQCTAHASEQDTHNATVNPRFTVYYTEAEGGGSRRRKYQQEANETDSTHSGVYASVDSPSIR